MASYFLQAKDRHNGNLLIDKAGHLVRKATDTETVEDKLQQYHSVEVQLFGVTFCGFEIFLVGFWFLTWNFLVFEFFWWILSVFRREGIWHLECRFVWNFLRCMK